MVYGNFENKYSTKNPVSKFLVRNFLKSLRKFLEKSGSAKKIVELGTGEGELIKIISELYPNTKIYGCDISKKIINTATKNLKNFNISLSVENIEKLSYPNKSFDLIVCCEVLEHVSNPLQALKEIKRISRGKIILSVPQEPLWRILNMSRLKYLKEFGNTPGHLNHWSKNKFIKLVESAGFEVLSVKLPLPWVMLLAK